MTLLVPDGSLAWKWIEAIVVGPLEVMVFDYKMSIVKGQVTVHQPTLYPGTVYSTSPNFQGSSSWIVSFQLL